MRQLTRAPQAILDLNEAIADLDQHSESAALASRCCGPQSGPQS